MRKIYNLIVLIILFSVYLKVPLYSQVLSVPLVIQEQDQWCWAASSACVLDYFNRTTSQCNIAEYTRSVSTSCNPNNYGTVNCCTDATQGCDQWNYNWGCPGSIQDILIHFGYIQTNSISDSIALSAIHTEISGGRPFIFRWGWSAGGGHFLVGYGVSGFTIYYMDPWIGEGYEINNVSWVDGGTNLEGTHTWTHTQTLANVGIANYSQQLEITIYPNPALNNFFIDAPENTIIEITNIQGQLIKTITASRNTTNVDVSTLSNGVYFVKLKTEKGITVEKLVKE